MFSRKSFEEGFVIWRSSSKATGMVWIWKRICWWRTEYFRIFKIFPSCAHAGKLLRPGQTRFDDNCECDLSLAAWQLLSFTSPRKGKGGWLFCNSKVILLLLSFSEKYKKVCTWGHDIWKNWMNARVNAICWQNIKSFVGKKKDLWKYFRTTGFQGQPSGSYAMS